MPEQASPLTIVVDDRERAGGLADALSAAWSSVAVGRLALGDVELGPRVLVERKTVPDFVASLADGRLLRQVYALSGAVHRPLLVVEGTDGSPLVNVAPNALRGVLLSIAVGSRVPLLRTDDVAETAEFLAHLARQEERRLARFEQADDGKPWRPRKAARSANLLGAIPGVGDLRVRTLIEHFGDPLRALTADEDELADVPGIGPATARAVRAEASGDGPGPGHEGGGRE